MENFTHISYHERHEIYRGISQGLSSKKIAERLGRSTSSLTREIGRNSDQYGYLYAGKAHERAIERRYQRKPKIDQDSELRAYIIAKINEKWSPRTIAGRWSLEHPDRPISAEAIYQWIYGPEGEKLGLSTMLIRARKKRGMIRKTKAKTFKDRVSVHDRPESVNQRSEPGHYEGDLMFNKGSQSRNICTLVDRVTRHAVLIFNDNKQTSTVIDALIRRIQQLGLTIKSITFDNGSEFADHWKLNILGINTYFCDPGSPWQKGAIENLNGLIRRYFPFMLSAFEITCDYVARMNLKINDMPRAILGFRTPNEVLREQLCIA